MVRRLWARFEVLPFRYGLGMGIVAAVVAALVIVGFVTLNGAPQKKEATPRPVSSGPAEAAVPPAPTWGGYVPPRQARSTTAVVSPSRTQAAEPTSPRPRPARPSVRPSPTQTCPATLKKSKWEWVYQMCKRKQSG
ncbi:hypothetical protein GCM10027176_08850 [Actinoallomurus bryophytorum]|uniref:Uncharacterized protein n=1 Tax=Actinoallomurus bryophytorum TaxID=1490222 RepID=A0A543CGC1_9ACTN|nr:hypothetical protein [Actinoallomurus bryophytorum]TQL95977.1 hypothetical protein FB559_1492 [Actinoallomurus bryophytorum]